MARGSRIKGDTIKGEIVATTYYYMLYGIHYLKDYRPTATSQTQWNHLTPLKQQHARRPNRHPCCPEPGPVCSKPWACLRWFAAMGRVSPRSDVRSILDLIHKSGDQRCVYGETCISCRTDSICTTHFCTTTIQNLPQYSFIHNACIDQHMIIYTQSRDEESGQFRM